MNQYYLWIKQGWALFAFLPILLLGNFVLYFSNYSEVAYKGISALAQIIGGFYILRALNDNIKIVLNQDIFFIITAWFKSFPLFKKSVNVSVTGSEIKFHEGNVRAYSENNFQTIEEKIEYIINEVKNLDTKLEKNIVQINDRITIESQKLSEKINQNSQEVQNISSNMNKIYGDLNIPIFGVLLMFYATIIGVIPDFLFK